jgi:hypothetical protein
MFDFASRCSHEWHVFGTTPCMSTKHSLHFLHLIPVTALVLIASACDPVADVDSEFERSYPADDDNGNDDGYDDGYDDGNDDGYDDGKDDGKDDGYDDDGDCGKDDGNDDGYDDGGDCGYDDGGCDGGGDGGMPPTPKKKKKEKPNKPGKPVPAPESAAELDELLYPTE